MQRHNDDTIKASDTVLSKKIPLTLFERVARERELETEQNCNILIPTLISITVFLSRSPGLPNLGPGDPLCWVLVFSIASYLQLVWSPTGLISNSSDLQLIWSPTDWISCAPRYIIVQLPPSSFGRHKSHPSTVKVIFLYSSTGCTCYLDVCFSYFVSPTGSEVNIQQKESPPGSVLVIGGT